MRKNLRRKRRDLATLSRKNRWFLICVPIVTFGGIAVLMHFISVVEQETSVAKTVQGWQSAFHFSDEQAARIEQIEIDFHGNGSPFSARRVHTAAEIKSHHEDIAHQMEAGQGSRFLQFMEKRE